MNNDRKNVFAKDDLLFAYSRKQALADGVLMDVSPLAREAGFCTPVALTCGLWADIQAIPESVCWQDHQGRLWDVLFVGREAIRRSREGGTQLLYSLRMPVGRKQNYTVKLLCGPGDDAEPVITLLRPHED